MDNNRHYSIKKQSSKKDKIDEYFNHVNQNLQDLLKTDQKGPT